jgi:hypothetical protein
MESSDCSATGRDSVTETDPDVAGARHLDLSSAEQRLQDTHPAVVTA